VRRIQIERGGRWYDLPGQDRNTAGTMDRHPHHYCVFETAAGFCAIAWTETGITCFRQPGQSLDATRRALLRRLPGATPAEPPPSVAAGIAAAQRYFQGEEVDFSDLALDLSTESDFFQRLYAALRRVGWGRTTTYGALAKEIGSGPEAARDVGQAMAHNPVPLIIPCHRVLAAGGKVGGFSAPGGAVAKVRMLEMEGLKLGPAAQGTLGL
jgi:methylated-DNA-[protein]-cysteine S-methyltransferase